LRSTSCSSRTISYICCRKKGGGSGSYNKWDKPMIDELTITHSLFAKYHFSSIFADKTDAIPVTEKTSSQDDSDAISIKMPLTVRDPALPLWVNKSIVYFWGPGFLPDNSTDKAVNFTSSNGGANLQFHNMTVHDRCSRNITD
ncbi:hypothetical protein PFISCL1PPCAC_3085, partial [Pristionchus fissidentatus]